MFLRKAFDPESMSGVAKHFIDGMIFSAQYRPVVCPLHLQQQMPSRIWPSLKLTWPGCTRCTLLNTIKSVLIYFYWPMFKRTRVSIDEHALQTYPSFDALDPNIPTWFPMNSAHEIHSKCDRAAVVLTFEFLATSCHRHTCSVIDIFCVHL